MTESLQLNRFIPACFKELEARLGLRVDFEDLSRQLDGRSLDAEAYRRVVSFLASYVREDRQELCVAQDHEPTPAHFVDLLAACLPEESDKQHVAACGDCSKRIALLLNAAVNVMLGADVDMARRYFKDEKESERGDLLASALLSGLLEHSVESIKSLKPLLGWGSLMQNPDFLALAFRAIEGLDPQQGSEVLALASRCVGGQKDRPDADRFREILRKTRELVEASSG